MDDGGAVGVASVLFREGFDCVGYGGRVDVDTVGRSMEEADASRGIHRLDLGVVPGHERHCPSKAKSTKSTWVEDFD